jgi:hypothetical protein
MTRDLMVAMSSFSSLKVLTHHGGSCVYFLLMSLSSHSLFVTVFLIFKFDSAYLCCSFSCVFLFCVIFFTNPKSVLFVSCIFISQLIFPLIFSGNHMYLYLFGSLLCDSPVFVSNPPLLLLCVLITRDTMYLHSLLCSASV